MPAPSAQDRSRAGSPQPPAPAVPALILDRISLSFDGKPVFADLSLSLAAGERVALMGPSGCGKTSLLRLAAGLLAPSSGKTERAAERIAVCFQEPRLLPWRTAAENVNLVLSDRSATMGEAERLLSRLGLDPAALKQYPAALSGGMRQRVALARTLAQKGDLLLLDEPFKALDAALRSQVIEAVLAESSGAAVLLVTHDKAEAEALGCRIAEFSSLLG
jgi:NitT/TauT family transport system ATP-binding protein